ncbi:MAG TPA: hypothetical protein VLG92_05975 [Candidatus Saccharimonadia bacterium]|nr:hypothetical protein [Candidatus Saccharimonadia bacterium]
MQRSGGQIALDSQGQLFLGLAEQLVRPLLQISQLAELGATDNPEVARVHWNTVQLISQTSLQLVESYALSLRLHSKVTPLQIEPITITSLLYDTAQILQPFAQEYGVRLELDSGPRTQPILADRTVLQAAMTSLGQVFVLGQAESDEPSAVHLSAHHSRYGVVAGLYSNTLQLAKEDLRRARSLKGRAREPLQRLTSGPAAAVFVADSLLNTLATRLHVARYRGLTGMAATLQPSEQLQLI